MSPDPIDLTADGDVLAQIAEHAADGAILRCIDVLEHLDHFVPVVEALVGAAGNGTTVLLSVPNTPITGTRGASTWGEGALEELKGLLPDDHVVLHEIPLRGTATLRADAQETLTMSVDVDGSAPPAKFLAAFGPRADELAIAQARAAPADLTAELAEERRLRSDVAFLEARVQELEAKLGPAAAAPPARQLTA